MEQSKLKSCPFCGSKAEVHMLSEKRYEVWCSKCPCALNCEYPSESIAVMCWNKRAGRRKKNSDE